MVQTIPASKVDLYILEEKFGLSEIETPDFFPEWQGELPELTDLEKQELIQVKANYRYLVKRPMLEQIVKMVVLSPLLKIAGFYQEPFYLTAEKQVTITSEDEGTIVSGKIDIFVSVPPFWVLAIEAKRVNFSLHVGIPQLLAYMLGSTELEYPAFGFVTNGYDFKFLKLIKQETPGYATSNSFTLEDGEELFTVAKILKHLARVVSQ
ncbi:MAG: restriction endonuclease subunit R [Cyanobacteriota bacterium]|nr:restriction endonuclease subunit R [Cyanobacteriota bacterium]